ncbi:MAG: NADH-quinone oxidoreductase subunit H, partial [Vampirovibrionia bacterium]
ERRTLALLTVRKGPNRVGYDGVFQSFADGIKIMFKEDIMSEGTNKIWFTLAPVIVMVPTIVVYVVLPFTKELVATNIAVGLLFILAVSSISTIGLLIAGWASNNKYSLLGGLRSAAQAISYEIPLIIAAIGTVILAGSLNLNEIITNQQGNALAGEATFVSLTNILAQVNLDGVIQPLQGILSFIFSWNFWHYNCFAAFLGCLVFFICAIAESNRIPFDLPEAESELVSGYSTEYSGMKFAMFFMAEYAALFAIAALTIILFFGGYLPYLNDYVVNYMITYIPAVKDLPFMTPQVIDALIHIEQAFWFSFKAWLFVFAAMWIRATLPRLRADQLMEFCWKILLPVSLVNLLIVTIIKELSF